jgi:Tfp pilus assembly protein PilO
MRSYRQQAPLVAAIILGLAVAGLTLGIVLQRVALARTSRQVRAGQRELIRARQEVKDRASWQKDYSELSLKLGGRLPECTWGEQMPFIVSQVTGIVESHGLMIETLRPEPMATSKRILRFPLRIGIQAGLRDVTQVIRDIERAVPLLDIERLDIRTAEGKGDKLQADMTVSSFVVLDKKSPVARRRAMRIPTELAKVEESAEEPARKAETPVSPIAASMQTPPAGPPAGMSSPTAGRTEDRKGRPPEGMMMRMHPAGTSGGPPPGAVPPESPKTAPNPTEPVPPNAESREGRVRVNVEESK